MESRRAQQANLLFPLARVSLEQEAHLQTKRVRARWHGHLRVPVMETSGTLGLFRAAAASRSALSFSSCSFCCCSFARRRLRASQNNSQNRTEAYWRIASASGCSAGASSAGAREKIPFRNSIISFLFFCFNKYK